MAERNILWAKEYFRGMGIQVVTESRYLGGFLGERAEEVRWIKEKVEGWAESVRILARVLLQEWEFVQQVTLGIGDAFRLLEEEIAK